MSMDTSANRRIVRRVSGVTRAGLLAVTLSALPAIAAEPTQSVGPESGEREFTVSGTGTSDRDFDSSSFGISADFGWYMSEQTLVGIRQSVSYTCCARRF